MKNNDLHKNQPNAQALNDDDLENVAGGFSCDENYFIYITQEEADYLNKMGFDVSEAGEYPYLFKTEIIDRYTSDAICYKPKEIEAFLKKHKFTYTSHKW